MDDFKYKDKDRKYRYEDGDPMYMKNYIKILRSEPEYIVGDIREDKDFIQPSGDFFETNFYEKPKDI